MLFLTGDDREFRIRASEASYATSPRNTATSSVHSLQDSSVHIHTRPSMIYYILPILLMYINVRLCYLFFKQLDYSIAAFLSPSYVFFCVLLDGTFVKRFHFVW